MENFRTQPASAGEAELGFNASAYFSLKLYDGSSQNSRVYPPLLSGAMRGRAAPLQQINFIAGFIVKDNAEGGGGIIYTKIPYIKVLSNINLAAGPNVGVEYPYYIDGLQLWEDRTNILTAVSPPVNPPVGIPANGTVYLMLKLSADITKQDASPAVATQTLFSDCNCFYDVRMYKDHTALNSSFSTNLQSPSNQPNDWRLLTQYQQLWLLGAQQVCLTLPPLEWEQHLSAGLPFNPSPRSTSFSLRNWA